MAIADRLNIPCTIVHVDTDDETATDDDGNVVEPETETNTVCYLEQRTAWDETIGQNVQLDEWHGLFPAGTALGGADRVVVAGSTYEMFGPPWPVWNPRTQQTVHLEARLKRTF